MNEDKLGEVLIKMGAINALDLAKAAQFQRKAGCTIGAALVETKAVTAEELARIAATLLKLPYISLRTVAVPTEMVKLLPAELAMKYKAIVLKVEGKNHWVAMSQPNNIATVDNLRFRFGGNVTPVVVPELDMERALEFYYGRLKHAPLQLPPSTGVDYKVEAFDIRKARAAQQAQGQAPAAPAQAPSKPPAKPAAPAAAAAPAVAASAAPAAKPPEPQPVAQPAQPPRPEPEEVLDLQAEAEPVAPETQGQGDAGTDDELIKQLADFLLGK
jgi:hypothetical protein